MKSKLYDCRNKFQVTNSVQLQNHIRSIGKFNYVYVLCYPPLEDFVRPFYVGIGQGDRIFAHEKEIKVKPTESHKHNVIKDLHDIGLEVLKFIDGFYDFEPWNQEQSLIEQFGCLYNNTGILTNRNSYSPSMKEEEVELRKYAAEGNQIPSNFLKKKIRLMVGPNKPNNSKSVYGKIYSILEKNPGVTGEELVYLLLETDFSGNKSAYTQTGKVSKPWLAKYIDGGFYKKNLCIQEFTL